MKFKVGEKVRLKHVLKAEKIGKTLIYRKLFEQFEGLTATIKKCYTEHDAYNIDIHFPQDTAFIHMTHFKRGKQIEIQNW